MLTHLTKREDLAAYNEEYAKFFPTNKTLQDDGGGDVELPELLVEITDCRPFPEAFGGEVRADDHGLKERQRLNA